MTPSEVLGRVCTHQSNVQRYRRLLRTRLAPIERQFLERRLAEEEATLSELNAGVLMDDLARNPALSADDMARG